MAGTFLKVQSVAAFPTCKWMGVATGLGGSRDHTDCHRDDDLNSSQYTEHSPHPRNPPASELSELPHLVSSKTMRLSKISVTINPQLEDTARYAGLLLAPAEGFGRAKKRAYYAVLNNSGNFWRPVVTLVSFSSNRSNFERNPKKKLNQKKIQKN